MITKDIEQVLRAFKKGENAAIPTETVYGLAGNAFNEDAVLNIFKVKGRPFFDPLIIHTNSVEKALTYVKDVPEKAHVLMKNLWPGPLTLVLPKIDQISDIVTSGLDTVGIRIPNHPITLELLSKLDFPLAAPSANPFGYISPTSAEDVEEQLGNKIPFVLDGGKSEIGVESTIVGFEGGTPIVYRLGGISLEKIQSLIGPCKVADNSSEKVLSPGMLKKHYAPRKPMYLGNIESLLTRHNHRNIGFLLFKNYIKEYPKNSQIVLSENGNFEEASKNLFSTMRTLDKMDVEVIYAEPLPNTELGRAVNDRLFRASIEVEEGLASGIYK